MAINYIRQNNRVPAAVRMRRRGDGIFGNADSAPAGLKRRLSACGLHIVQVAALLVSWLSVPAACADDVMDARRRELENMSAVERDQLLRKQAAFEKLTDAEQERLRQLDETLTGDPEGQRLREIMLRYHTWLAALPSSQRTEIVSLPPEQRVAKIKERVSEQIERRRQELAQDSINGPDVAKIRSWLMEIYTRVEPKLLEQLDSEQREDVLRLSSPQMRFPWVMNMITRGKGMESNPQRHLVALEITSEDHQRLVESLSESAQQYYARMDTDDERRALVQNWTWVAIWRGIARESSRLSGDQLRRFLEGADPKLRDQLDYLPPEKRRAWIERNLRGRGMGDFGRGGSGRGGRGQGRRGGGLDDVRPPPQDAMPPPKPKPDSNQPSSKPD
jgi:hypothetical protein